MQYVAASQPNIVTGAVSQPNPSPLPSIQPSGASGSASQQNLSHGREQWHLLTQSSGPVYTRIPVASQNKASYVYSSMLNKLIKANKNNDETAETAWQKFFGFGMNGLGCSKRGGTKHVSQATLINKRLDAFVSGSVVPEKTTKAKSSKPSQSALASRVTAKLSMGDVRGAVTVVTSRESILPPSLETKKMLQAKNPPRKRSEPAHVPTPDSNGNLSHFWVSKEDVKWAIRSFKKGAAGGPDGFRP